MIFEVTSKRFTNRPSQGQNFDPNTNIFQMLFLPYLIKLLSIQKLYTILNIIATKAPKPIFEYQICLSQNPFEILYQHQSMPVLLQK